MNEKTSPCYTPEQLLFFYIVGLRYTLAGDLESTEHIDFLEQRWRSIRWDDPEFIQTTDEMRAGVPKLTPQQEKSLQAPLLALLNTMSERIASHSETDQINAIQLKSIKDMVIQSQVQFDRLLNFTKKLNDVAIKMRDRLELLHDDVSVFEFPEL